MQRNINRLKENTAFLTLKIQQNKRECHERNEYIKKEKNKIVGHFHDLKKKMAASRDKEEKRLGDLTINSK